MSAVDVAARGLAARAISAGQALFEDGGAALIGTSFGIDLESRLGETVSILEGVDAGTHNAVLAGTNEDDHTAGVQVLVDQLSNAGGGVIEVPGNCRLNFDRLEPKSFVSFRGASAQGSSAPPWQGGLPIFTALPGAPWIVEGGSARLLGASFQGIKFAGRYTDHAGGGVHIPDWFRSGMRQCVFEGFTEQALYVGAAQLVMVAVVFALNCLLERNRASQSGVLQFDALTDSMLVRGEFTSSITSGDVTSADLRCAAVAVLGGGSSWILDVLAEFGDVGFHIEGVYHVVRGCRSDLNRAHGFRLGMKNGQVVGNKGFRNGRAADGIYSDFKVEAITAGYGVGNQFNGNVGISYARDPNRVAHVIHDVAATSANPNSYVDTKGLYHRLATYNLPAGIGAQVQTGTARIFTNGDTTPSVDNCDQWRWIGSPAVTISNFDDGVDGQEIVVAANNANVSIAHGSGIANLNLGARALLTNRPCRYVRRDGVWYEMPTTFPGGNVHQTVGDANFTVTGSWQSVVRWIATLSANRTCTLQATSASRGDRVRIVRAAGGAFDLNVSNNGSGTLKTLAQNTWGDFEFDGSNWAIIGYGQL